MRIREYGVALGVAASMLAGTVACGSGGGAKADASDEVTADAESSEVDSSLGDAGDGAAGDGATTDSSSGDGSLPDSDGALDCTPMLVDAATIPPFVPPNPRQSACTTAQIQGLYQACMAGSPASCTAFNGDPANAACVACMSSDSTARSWGPIVNFTSMGMSYPNTSGCLALVDNDGGPGSCAAMLQKEQFCVIDACGTSCPSGGTPAGVAAVNRCEGWAATSVCPQYAPPSQMCPAMYYSMCQFADYQSAFVGLGEFFCASGPDGGTMLDAGSD
jgi:hypothetical protein